MYGDTINIKVQYNPAGQSTTLNTALQYVKENYAKTTDLAAKQDTLTAGTGITIENNVISATSSGGGSSYTDNDVYNAIQNRFGMGMTEGGLSFNNLGGTSGTDGTATLDFQGDFGQLEGIRICQALMDEPYLDYTAHFDDGTYYIANYEGTDYRISQSYNSDTDVITLTINYPTAVFSGAMDVKGYYSGRTSYNPLSSNYYDYDSIYNEMQNRGMSGDGGSIQSNALMTIENNEAYSILGARISQESGGSRVLFDEVLDANAQSAGMKEIYYADSFDNNSGGTFTIMADMDDLWSGDISWTHDEESERYFFEYEVNGNVYNVNYYGMDGKFDVYFPVGANVTQITLTQSAPATVTYTPIDMSFMPVDALDNRYANQGGGGESFTPTSNSLLT